MWFLRCCIVIYSLNVAVQGLQAQHNRQRRYLIFTPFTQWGVFATVAVPFETEATVSVAWFFEANYYTVDNATWFQPLLGDVEISKREHRRSTDTGNILSRKYFYTFIENMLENTELGYGNLILLLPLFRFSLLYLCLNCPSILNTVHGHPGQHCLLRAICENATSHFLHNGILGDLLHLLLTPSTSMSEDDIEDCYYEAEYWGLEDKCYYYEDACSTSPLEYMSFTL